MKDHDLNTSYALYIFAGIFFLVSIIYFGIEVVFQLSPVTKSVLLLSMTSIIISTGIWFKGGPKSALTYITGFLSYVVFLGYTLARFSPSTEATLGSLLASATVFAVVGKLLNDEKLQLETKQLKLVAAGIVLISGVLTGVDLVGAQPSYEPDFKETINISEGENKIGELRVENEFILHRGYELPEYEACGFNDQGREELRLDVGDYSSEEGIIAGKNTRSFDINYTAREVVLDRENPENRELRFAGEYRIERSESCPSDGENMTIYVQSESPDPVFD